MNYELLIMNCNEEKRQRDRQMFFLPITNYPLPITHYPLPKKNHPTLRAPLQWRGIKKPPCSKEQDGFLYNT